MTLISPSSDGVLMTLGGRPVSARGQTFSPSSVHLVLSDRPRLEPGHMDERVVAVTDAERPLGTAEDCDLAARVGLHPNGRLGLADIAQHGAEEELRHGRSLRGRETPRRASGYGP